MANPVIFTDVDGPLIPDRARYLKNQTTIHSVFDPVATDMLKRVCDQTGAKLVISSQHGIFGLEHCRQLFDNNGINSSQYFHISEAITPRVFQPNREAEITHWLAKHPETNIWAILDDERLALPGMVHVTWADGMLLKHYQDLLFLLSQRSMY